MSESGPVERPLLRTAWRRAAGCFLQVRLSVSVAGCISASDLGAHCTCLMLAIYYRGVECCCNRSSPMSAQSQAPLECVCEVRIGCLCGRLLCLVYVREVLNLFHFPFFFLNEGVTGSLIVVVIGFISKLIFCRCNSRFPVLTRNFYA